MNTRRDFLKRATLCAAHCAVAPAILRGRFQLFRHTNTEYSARAVRLVEETVTVDLLNQFRFANFTEESPRPMRWFNRPGSFTSSDFMLYRTSGTRVFALGSGPGRYDDSIKFFADWNGLIAGYDEYFLRIDDGEDFKRLQRGNRIGILLSCQTSDHFRTVDDIDTFYALGQRISQLTYNSTTRTGSGFLADDDAGLTEYGAAVIARMNTVGMAVDLSHCADRTTLDALSVAKRPTLFSHASTRALLPGHLRSKTDEMIRKMAATGGVMGIPFLRFMIRGDEPVTIEHAIDHVDHVAKLVGIEHVGIGSDMDVLGNATAIGGNAPPPSAQPNFERYHVHRDSDGKTTIQQLDHPKRMYDFAEALIRRKYSDAAIRGVLGENWQRTLGQIWLSRP